MRSKFTKEQNKERVAMYFNEIRDAIKKKDIFNLDYSIGVIILSCDLETQVERIELAKAVETLCKLKVNDTKQDIASRLLIDVKHSGL